MKPPSEGRRPADSLLSEVEVEVVSKHEKDRLLHGLEKVHAD